MTKINTAKDKITLTSIKEVIFSGYLEYTK